MLKPDADELRLDFSYAIDEPIIQFIVDDKVIETTDTYPNINVSNNKPHTMGVNVFHLLETNEDAPIKVKFEHAWTNVKTWKPRTTHERRRVWQIQSI